MNVLSLFDGMSCGRIALERAGILVDNYYASEIKKAAIKVSSNNYPDIIHVGDVTQLDCSKLPPIDLLIGGSPCQDFSILNTHRLGLDGTKSKLFYEYLRVLNELKPRWFLLENVKMKKEAYNELNDYLGVSGYTINSNLFSFQNRPRIYWTNIPFSKDIVDKNINFQDYIGIGDIAESKVNKTPCRIKMWNGGKGRDNIKSCENITNATKIGCLTRKQDRAPNSGLIACDDFCRYLTRREMELAQTVPEGYTDSVSYNQAQDLLGDGWTVDVIAHILKGLKQ